MLRKVLLVSLLLLIALASTGCWKYGKGETIGYIYAVDDGIAWDKIWFKSNLQSSESDCYLIKDDALKEQLRQVSGDAKVRLYYDRHLFTIASCPEGTSTNDEIVRFEILED